MQDGAGTVGLCAYFENLMDDAEFSTQRENIRLNDGVSLHSKESLYYYKAFLEKTTNLQLVEDALDAMDTWSLTQNFAVCVARIQSSLCFSIYEVFLKRCACIRCSRNNSPYPHIFALLLTR